MSDIWIPYGGGADLDPVTATATDVRKGKTIVDKDGNPIGGTMPDIAGRTITPTTSQQTLNGGGYLTGDIVVPGFTPPSANVIKKGYVLNLFGIKITGSFEGWVAGNGELYRYGDNAAGFAPSAYPNVVVFDSGQITVNCANSALNMEIRSSQPYNTGPWNYVNVLLNRTESIGSGVGFSSGIQINGINIYPEGSVDMNFLNFYGEQNVRFHLQGLSVTGAVKLFAYRFRGSIKRIYFS